MHQSSTVWPWIAATDRQLHPTSGGFRSRRLARLTDPSPTAAVGDLEELLGRESREPIDRMPPGIASILLRQIDGALDQDNLPHALAIERLLPSTLGAEPAVVDRMVTLRLREDDVGTAAAGLGACATEASPRLYLLRMVVAVRCDETAVLATSRTTESQPIGLATRVLLQFVASVGGTSGLDGGCRTGTDPAAAICSLAAGRPRPVATLTAALAVLDRLLAGIAAPPPQSMAAAVWTSLHGVARDLDISLRPSPPSGELAVTPSDRARLRLRAA